MVGVIDKEEIERLETLSRYAILDSADEPAFNDLADLAARTCNAPISLISFLDREREWFKAHLGTSVQQIPRDHAFATRAMDRKDLVIVRDALSDDALRENPLVREEPHARFFAGCPLITPDGQPIGALYVLDHEPHELTPEQQQILSILSHEAVMLLELRREVNETRARNEAATRELEQLRAKLQTEAKEHRAREENLKRRQEQLSSVKAGCFLWNWDWHLETNSFCWSDELYRMFGVQPESFEGTYDAYLRLVHPEDREQAHQVIQRALLTHEPFESEYRVIRGDGQVRVVKWRGEVYRNDAGEPVRIAGCTHDVTERREMEGKLRHSHSLLAATLDSTADGILVVDLNGRVIQFNRRFSTLWHLPPEFPELYDDRRLQHLVLEQLDDPSVFLDRVDAIYRNKECESFDVLEFKDGRTFERLSCPQRLGDEIIGRVWSFRDVTERARAIKVLRESEERYRSLVLATAQVVWTTNPDGEVTADSPTWREFTGQTFPEMKHGGWLNAVHPRDRGRVGEMWSHALRTGTIYEVEFQLRRADAEWRHVATRGVPIKNEDGTIREWIGYCFDITDRKQAEDLVLNERDFSHAIINSLPGIFYLLDEHGLNLRWNENLEIISGYSATEISKMKATDFVPEEEKLQVAQRVAKVFTTGEADVELTFLTKDGKRIPFFCTGKLVHIEGLMRLVGMGIDISGLKRAEAEIRRLNTELENRVKQRTAELKAANKELESFTYTASHDLRSPIRAIIGFAMAVRQDSGHLLDAENREYLDRIIQAGDRMMQLIDDLLGYCSVGKKSVHLRAIRLAEPLKEVLQELGPRLTTVGAELVQPEEMPVVLGDRTLLRQIFANLLDNAVNYRKPQEPLRVEITSRRERDSVIIRIADNGIGIPADQHGRIFEVFHRLHQDKYAGTGIGLATVKRAAEKLGGDVWVQSEEGKGSVFSVRLKRPA